MYRFHAALCKERHGHKMRKKTKYLIRRIVLLIILIALMTGAFFVISDFINNNISGEDITEPDANIDGESKGNGQNKPDNSDNNQPKNDDDPPEKEDINITLSAVGDIMFHPRQIWGAYDDKTDSFDFKPYFEPIKSIIEAADIAVGNFEGTTCGDDIYEYQGYPLFNAPDEVLDAIKYAGFDVLSTVNNHTLDTRKTGVIRTIEKMDARGLAHVGTYVEKPDTRVLMQDVKGIKIAFLAYTEMLNGLESVMTPEDLDSMVNTLDETKIKEDIAYARENKADLIVMIVHWGDEYIRTPNARQKNWADFMLSEGIDVILGSHPHVIQDVEDTVYNDKRVFVAYSTGNFISNQRTEEELPPQTEDGVILTLKIKKSAETGKTTIEDIDYIPTWVYRTKQEGKNTFTYRILPVMEYIESNDYPESVKERMRRSYNDTMSKLESTNP